MESKDREIILHFDVNKTVLISDLVQGLDKQKLVAISSQKMIRKMNSFVIVNEIDP